MLYFQSSEHIVGVGEELKDGTGVENPGPVNDSDTGVTEAEVKDGRGKKKTPIWLQLPLPTFKR